jgi:N-acetylglucosaminyldiphosphoundecaprenol N-acetyl-beta-D-mannosaminyltransferase
VPVAPLDMEQALAHVADHLLNQSKGYICLIGVHGIMEAQRHPSLAQIYNHASLMVPDGAPTVWVGRWQGFSSMQRVAGPDLMVEVFRRPEFSHFTHFLYGGKVGVAEELRDRLTRRFPWTKIVGTHTPPYRDLTEAEEEQFAAKIRIL